MLSHSGAAELFGSPQICLLDELHALASSKRGDLLALDLARLRTHSPELTAIGLSATVARPYELAAFLVPQQGPGVDAARRDRGGARGRQAPTSPSSTSEAELPWAGHSARYALPEIYQAIKAHRMSLIFVNTRSQAELLFQELWRCNDDNLPIALHHGSLDVAQRRKVEAAMAAGKLRAVVCTSTLDLGIDWGDVDLVINVGAPKGASRLAQRIGRANHRLDEPSKALLVPANRFEVLECQAALEAAAEGAQDTPPSRPGALDVLAQHVLGTACAGPFHPDRALSRGSERRALPGPDARGLRPGRRFRRDRRLCARQLRALRQAEEDPGRRLSPRPSPHRPAISAQCRHHRRGADAQRPACAAARASVLVAGRVLGEVEEYFIEQLTPGDTFVFAGEVLRFEGLREMDAFVTRAHATDPKVPTYDGGKFPLSTYLAERVRKLLADPQTLDAASRPGRRLAPPASRVLGLPGAGRGPGRDLPARQAALSRLLSVRGAARASDARHAADAAPGARRRGAARLRRQRLCARDLGAQRHGRDGQGRAARPRSDCSTRTCSATTSTRGSPSRA